MDLIDLGEDGTKKGSYRYNSGIIDNFSKFGWTIPFNRKLAQVIEGPFGKIRNSSNTKPKYFQSDAGEEFVKKDIINFSN